MPGIDLSWTNPIASFGAAVTLMLQGCAMATTWLCGLIAAAGVFCLGCLWGAEFKIAPLRRRVLSLVVIAAAFLAGVAVAGQPDQAEVLFQRAVSREVTDGNLEEAIRLYRQVIDQPNGSRPLAARALVNIGRCYEKLGDAEARKAYERVVRDFTDQKDSLQAARERLAALGLAGAAAGPSMKMIWSDSLTDIEGAPSPDGRHLTFVDWNTGDLAIRDLKTVQNRRLTDKGPWEKSQEFALFSEWSPDGKRIAFDWYVPAKGTSLEVTVQVRLTDPDGSNQRVLYETEKDGWLMVLGWSPDGRNVAIWLEGAGLGTGTVALVSAESGALRRILDLQAGKIVPEVLSPDGKYILASYRPEPGRSDVVLFPVDGGPMIPVTDHPAHDAAVGWHPSGEWVLFASDRTGNLSLYAVRIEREKVTGTPYRVPLAIPPGQNPMGFTRQGAFFLGRSSRLRDIFSMELDPATGRIQSQPAKFVHLYEGVNDWPAFSRDGRLLAYISARGALPQASQRGNTLSILDMNTRKTTEFAPESATLYNPLWLGDERSLNCVRYIDGVWELVRFDLGATQSKVLKRFVREKDEELDSHATAPDGKTVFYGQRNPKKDVSAIFEIDLDTGRERELLRGKGSEISKFAISPDGKELAIVNRADERVIRILPVSGGTPRELCRYEHKGNHMVELAWTADGKYLLFPRPDGPPAADMTWSLWRVRVADGQLEKLLPNCGRVGKVTAHPDGKTIIFSAIGKETQNAEVWVLENFLPPKETKPAGK